MSTSTELLRDICLHAAVWLRTNLVNVFSLHESQELSRRLAWATNRQPGLASPPPTTGQHKCNKAAPPWLIAVLLWIFSPTATFSIHLKFELNVLMYIWLKTPFKKILFGLIWIWIFNKNLSELCYLCFTGQLHFPFIACFLLPWLQFLPLGTNITQLKVIPTAHTAVNILGTASKHLFFTVYGKKKEGEIFKTETKDWQNVKVQKKMVLCKDPGTPTRTKQKSDAS